nr:hypothetical protein [Tissierella sp.]
MKKNNFLKNISIIFFLGIFLVGCTAKDNSLDLVSLDFLVTPEQLRIHSDTQLKELNEAEEKVIASTESMKEKYDDVLKMSEEDIKIQEDIVKQAENLLYSGQVIDDKNTIENIFNQLRGLEGVYVDSFEEDVKARIELIEDPETLSVETLDNSYLRIFMLLEDSSIVIPKGIMENSTKELEATGEIEYIKVKLPENLNDELKELIEK